MKRTQWIIVLAALALGVVGCGDDDSTVDGGLDAGRDGGLDAGPDSQVMTDAGDDAGDDDAGGDDAGGDDAGMDDAGMDAGMTMVGGGAATSAQIDMVFEAADGAATLMIEDAVVTYVKGAVDDNEDGAGFFLQAEMTGPAIYIGVDPSTLTPPPAVGQVVDLRITTLATAGMLRYATTVDMWSVASSGHSVDFLVQEVSAVDLVTNLDDYAAELVSLSATIEGDFVGAGTGFRAAQITSAGVTTASSDFRFRLPESVLSTLTVGLGCAVDIGPTPLWRFNTSAQASAWAAADVDVDCPAPATAGDLVISEVGYLFAGSDDDLEFIEIHNPSTAAYDLGGCILSDSNGPADEDAFTLPADLVIGPGAYFVIAGSASEISGDAVLPTALGFGGSDLVQLTCGGTTIDAVDWTTMAFGAGDDVSMQLDPTQLDATANDTLTNWCGTREGNTYGTMGRRGTPGAANVSCVVPAVVRINELNANITQCDLIELRVVSGGSMAGFRLQERGSTVYTFADGFEVSTNDLIVVHFNRGNMTCTGGVANPADETTSVNEVPSSTVSTNYDTAYDVYSTDTGLTNTDNVFGLVDAAGAFVDAVLASDDVTGTAAAASETAAAAVAAAGEWTTPAGTIPAGGFIDDDFSVNAVQDLNGTGTDASGESIQRNNDVDTNHSGGWTQTASSWGALNAGQTAF